MNTHKQIVSILFALVFLSLSPASAQWVQLGLPNRDIGEIAVGSSGLFGITTDSGTVYRSTDGGANWSQIVQSRGTHIAVCPNGATFLVMADSVYRSTDGGASWNNLRMREQLGGYVMNIFCVAVGPYGSVFSGYRRPFSGDNKGSETVSAISTDNGTTWTSGGLYGGEAYIFREHSVITGGGDAGGDFGERWLLFSFDDGLTWSNGLRNCLPQPPFTWCSNGNILGADLNWLRRGLFLSADTCASSTQVSDISPSALLALPNGGVIVGTDTTGIYLFSDNGDSIKTLNEGLSDLHVHVVALDSSGNAYAGTNKGIWRRPVSELVVSVNPGVTKLPQECLLHQNYPNPFNPSTQITYTLEKASNVSLTVYDILGREIATLVNGKNEPGEHTVTWNAEKVPSGVYFCRLNAGSFVQTKKMILMK